ncbi:hypothetical protein V8C42DRAFT_252212 [Trichoderma barbatum]
MEHLPTILEGVVRQHRLFWFLALVPIVFQADSFFLLLFFCPFYHRRTRRFFFLSIVLFPPLLTLPSPAAKLFSIFYDSTYIPLYQRGIKKKRLDAVTFSFSLPFFRLRSIVFVFFSPVPFFFPFLWRETERREGQMCTYAILLREKKIPGLQERKADTELALLVEKVGSMSAHTIAMG